MTSKTRFSREGESIPVTVDHVADCRHRYPGEVVTFYTQVTSHEPQSDLTLRISLPDGLELESYRPPSQIPDAAPRVESGSGVQHLAWSLGNEMAVGERYEFLTRVRVGHVLRDTGFENRAVLSDADGAVLDEEAASFVVLAKGRYLRYLPELYEQDEFMGRFLMLFESFWAPIETQVGSVDNYLDPEMAPTSFLPWLASWMNLVLPGSISEERRRQLLLAAIPLFRRRGTRRGLQDYLDIYTGGISQIVEHRAWDFQLGPEARLGPGIALGEGNVPHTFTVTLRLPPASVPDMADGDDVQAEELGRRRMIESIIEAEKPAHTGYNLHLEIDPRL